MMLGAFETLYDGVPPAWLRKIEAKVLMDVFADAFDVEPPEVGHLDASGALLAFREFTAGCMEAALVDEQMAWRYRDRLGDRAYRLGNKVRTALRVRPSQAMRIVRFFYRGIGIELSGELPGALRFGPCSFSGRYTPGDCWLMSAFDEGFMRGMAGRADAALAFTCRLTEGGTHCDARFG